MMMVSLRPFLAVCLALSLCLTAQGLAMSRGVSTATGQMVICTGNGPVSIHVDASGQPAPAPKYCPDFALSVLGALAVGAIREPVPPAGSGRALPTGMPWPGIAAVLSPRARAPPLFLRTV